jgi:predicted transcriptional regulator
MRHNVPAFRQITGNPTWSMLSMQQARRLMARAKSQVRHGTGITHSTIAVLEALVWRYRHKASGVCMASMATIAEAAKVSTDTVKRAITQLAKLGLVQRHARHAVWTIAGVAVRVRTANGYTFAKIEDDQANDERAGEGVGAKCAGSTKVIENNSLRQGLKRQAMVVMGWVARQEEAARRSVAQQLALLARG